MLDLFFIGSGMVATLAALSALFISWEADKRLRRLERFVDEATSHLTREVEVIQRHSALFQAVATTLRNHEDRLKERKEAEEQILAKLCQ